MAFSCADIDTLVHAYLDGELAAHDLEELEQHVARCAACRARVDEELQFRAELRHRLTAPPASDLLRARVTALLDAEDRAAVAAQRRRGVSWILPGAASLAAAAALVMVVVVPAGDDQPTAPGNDNRAQQPTSVASGNAPINMPMLQTPGVKAKRATFDKGSGRSAVLYEVERGQSRHEMQMEMFTDVRDLPPMPPRSAYTLFSFGGRLYLFTSPSLPQEEIRQLVEASSSGWLRYHTDPDR